MGSPAEQSHGTMGGMVARTDASHRPPASPSGRVVAPPVAVKSAGLTRGDQLEGLALALAQPVHLGRQVQTLDSFMPMGLDSLVEEMAAHLPSTEMSKVFLPTMMGSNGWQLIIERRSDPELVIAINAHDAKGELKGVYAIGNPVRDTLLQAIRDAKLAHRITLLLLSGEQFSVLRELAGNETARNKFLGELNSEETARENFLTILQRAVKQGATDIHVEPFNSKEYRIRYRIDGVLHHDGRMIPSQRGHALVRAIKVMGSAVNEDARKPWDGSISPNGELLDQVPTMRGRSLRISTMPTPHGEDAAIRILQSAEVAKLKLADLRFPPEVEFRLRRLLEAPNGVLLVAGPTGSGKTTTLAAALAELNDVGTKIITLEDPVEQEQPGVIQSPMRSDLDYTFAQALRSTLRHDPDVILVGEVRDAETAQVMTQGANTGHLLLSTIHTNDSISVFKRLRELGVDESQILASLLGVFSQRLVRCLCTGCRQSYDASEELSKMLGADPQLDAVAKQLPFWRVGPKDKVACCRECAGRGYRGRIAIPELWVIGEGERDLISRGDTGHKALFAAAVQGGMMPMSLAGFDYAMQGVTDLAELKTNVIRPDELISKRGMFIDHLRSRITH